MRNVLKISAPLLVGAAVLAVPAAAQFGPPPPGGYPDQVNHKPIIYADLGDGGPGQFTGVIDKDKNQLCYIIDVPGLQATAAHIHVGEAGKDGPVAVPLEAPKAGASGGCVDLKPDVEQQLLTNPGGYYVNVHTAAYPMGATRGQLKVYFPKSY